MKVYEMVFHKGFDESTRFFFNINNTASRKHFMKLMREDVDRELSDFKKSCVSDAKYDLLNLFQEVYAESHFHLDTMEKDFIQNGKAIFFDNIFLSVEEREVLKIL
ncbi:hypothetical protein NGC85_06190 [Acinetobacter sp. Z1]|uniref:hypothetical protein n=1 Tax=Acinetobacter sp. Z1 TaxID=2953738 RepID=UPI0020C97F1D|nr:hypothetical protein [Acinetobacter sp. Z1]UTO20669.1 hypothetical protein NGC85_06190 [Acinetobacter sp. Z1]